MSQPEGDSRPSALQNALRIRSQFSISSSAWASSVVDFAKSKVPTRSFPRRSVSDMYKVPLRGSPSVFTFGKKATGTSARCTVEMAALKVHMGWYGDPKNRA